MARMEFGAALSEDDVLVVQGVEYRMQPIGMRAIKRLIAKRSELQKIAAGNVDEVRPEMVDSMSEFVCSAVHPDERERLAEQIEETVDTGLLAEMVSALMGEAADVDPTQPMSSSDGSSATGSSSTDGALPVASTL